MKNLRPYLLSLLGALVVVAPIAVATPVSASTGVTITPSKSVGLIDGESITLTLTGIPAAQGVYVRQCYLPTLGQRDSTGLKCNGSLTRISEMIWATMNGARGSQSAAGSLTLPLKSRVVMYEADGKTVKETFSCGISDCAIFVHRDHMGLQDASLDAVFPLTFLGKQVIKARQVGLAKNDTAQKVGSSIALRNSALVTDQKSSVRVLSKSPKTCSVTKGSTMTIVRFTKAGPCELQLVAKATKSHQRFVATFTYTVN
jgi:hypothetical protein